MEKKKIASTVKANALEPALNKLTGPFHVRSKLFLFAIGIFGLLLLLGVTIFTARRTSLVQNEGSKTEFETQGAQICVGESSFSFALDMPYELVDSDGESIVVTTNNAVVSVGKNAASPEESLNEFAIPFTKSGDTYVYQLTSGWSDEISTEMPISAKTAYINGFSISVYYASLDEARAEKTLTAISQSINEGCHET